MSYSSRQVLERSKLKCITLLHHFSQFKADVFMLMFLLELRRSNRDSMSLLSPALVRIESYPAAYRSCMVLITL